MVNTKTKSRILFEILNAVFMIVLALVCLYPMLYVVFASFSEPNAFISHSGVLLKPLGFDTISYERAFSHPMILTGYANTLFVLVVGTLISFLLTAIGAYFLSQKDILWQKAVSFFIIFTMFFSGGLIPTYFSVKNFAILLPWFEKGTFVWKSVGIFNTIWALIIPTAISTYNMIVLRTGFMALPDSLIESAKLDGAGHIRILFTIVIPLAKASVAVIILYYGVGYWNSWFNASIYLSDNKLFPLQLVLRQILLINSESTMTSGVDLGDQMAVSETIKYAVIVIATLPILCIYPLLQKYFVSGVMIGAVKG